MRAARIPNIKKKGNSKHSKRKKNNKILEVIKKRSKENPEHNIKKEYSPRTWTE